MGTQSEEMFETVEGPLRDMLDQAHASSLVLIDSIKLRISHQEKLAGLCAATLALSFTAATTFHSTRAQELTALPHLLHAWRLLLAAIMLAVFSNWCAVMSLIHLGNSLGHHQVSFRLSLMTRALTKTYPAYLKAAQKDVETNALKIPRWERIQRAFNTASMVLGWSAQIAAFWAFVLLYLFGKMMLGG